MAPDNTDATQQLLTELEALNQLLDTPPEDNIPILEETVDQAELPIEKENPFLPRSVLERLAQERVAAQHSAEEAHRTMQRINQQRQQQASNLLSGIGKQLTREQKDALVQQMVDEMLPQIAERLKERLQVMLGR